MSIPRLAATDSGDVGTLHHGAHSLEHEPASRARGNPPNREPQFDRAVKPRLWQVGLVIAILLGTYTNYALDVGALVYGIVPLVAGGFLFVRRLRENPHVPRLVVYLVLICTVINLGSASFPFDIIELAKSTALLIGSVVAGIGFFLELRKWPRRWFESLIIVAVSVVILFGYLEAFTRFAKVSDSVRETLYAAEGQFLYSSDEQDLYLHGAVRPKIFTQEPSHPAKFLAVALCSWLLVSSRPQKLLIALFGFVLAAYMLRSPSLFAGPVLALYFVLCGSDGQLTMKSATVRLVTFGICAAIILSLPRWVSIVPSERAQEIAQGSDASTIIRLLGPMQIATELLWEEPLFGVGIGGKEYAWETMLGVYSNFPIVKMERFYLMTDAGWGNAFFQFIAYTGIVGATAIFWWLALLARQMIVKDWPSILFAFFVIFSADGSFNIVRPWIYLFLLGAAYHIRVRDRLSARLEPSMISRNATTPIRFAASTIRRP